MIDYLLKFTSKTNAKNSLPDEYMIDGEWDTNIVSEITLIKSDAVYSYDEETGAGTEISPMVKVSGYWLTTTIPNLPGQTAVIDRETAKRVTGPDSILGARINPAWAGASYDPISNLDVYVPPAPTKQELIDYMTAKAKDVEQGGFTLGGIAIATDDRSKLMVLGARVAAEADSSFTTPWNASDGAVFELNSTQVIGISNAVLAHVQAVFVAKAAIYTAIEAETITDFSQIDAASWPSNS